MGENKARVKKKTQESFYAVSYNLELQMSVISGIE